MTHSGDPSVILQYDPRQDTQIRVAEQTRIYETLGLYTGMSKQEIDADLEEKMVVLKWLLKRDIKNVHKIGVVMAKYYRGEIFKSDFNKSLHKAILKQDMN